MPLQSGIFTITRFKAIALISSIITALTGYFIRYFVMYCYDYDVLGGLENVYPSLCYFGFMGIIGFVIKEAVNAFSLMYDFGDTMPASNNTAGTSSLPVGSERDGLTSSMQAPNNSNIGGSSTTDSSTTDSSTNDPRIAMQNRIRTVEIKVNNFRNELRDYETMMSDHIDNRSDFIQKNGEAT